MVINSALSLFAFLPIFLGISYFVNERLKNFVLLISSLIFYAWGDTIFLLVLLLSCFVNYEFGKLISLDKNNYIDIAPNKATVYGNYLPIIPSGENKN